MRAKVSLVAAEIDEDYKRRKAYEIKRKAKCNKKCNECKYAKVCGEREKREK